jgi:hypothetical protein
MKNYFKRTSFWQKVRDSLAVFGVPSGALAAIVGTDPLWLTISAISAALVALIAIWLVDKDGNGIVDIFEDK